MGQQVRYAALAVAVLAIAGVVAFTSLHPKTGGGILAFNNSAPTITTVAPQAFGTLSGLNSTANTGGTNTNGGTAATAPQTQAGAQTSAGPRAASINSGAINTLAPAIVPRPIGGPIMPPGFGYNTIKYTYTGGAFSQDQSQLNVLKQISQSFSADQATAALEQAGFSPVNLSSFDGLTMNNVTLSQNQSFGYTISIDLQGGTISIDENYNEWPQNNNATPLTAANVPSDSAVINIANQFLSAHSISTASYGTPQVSPTNIVVPVAMSAGSAGAGAGGTANTSASAGTNAAVGTQAMPMIPYYSDSEQVLYPLMINGENVYDTNGNAIGMNVIVNVRYGRVSSVYGLQAQSYQSSAYDAITSTSTIISMAESTPSYPIMIYNTLDSGSTGSAVGSEAPTPTPTTNPTNGDTVTVRHLGTPTMAYEEMYQTDSNGQSAEFLIPAFAFPVAGATTDTQPQLIMVPLVSAFVKQSNPPRAIPYSAPATTGGPAPLPKAQ
jgi:hypothetical protein